MRELSVKSSKLELKRSDVETNAIHSSSSTPFPIATSNFVHGPIPIRRHSILGTEIDIWGNL